MRNRLNRLGLESKSHYKLINRGGAGWLLVSQYFQLASV